VKCVAANPTALGGNEFRRMGRYVETGIATLGIKQRRVIELVHFDGYTLQEASEILRESLAKYEKSILQRAEGAERVSERESCLEEGR